MIKNKAKENCEKNFFKQNQQELLSENHEVRDKKKSKDKTRIYSSMRFAL